MPEQTPGERRVYRTCSLCEATCGLELTVKDGQVTRIRGDQDDVFSAGFLCPKGVALGELHTDPDRLRAPLIRTADGFREVSWETAFAHVEAGLAPILARGDRNAVALYVGNPTAHNMGANLYMRPLVRALRSRNFYTSSTVDQMPKHLVSGLLFGDPLALPVPDVDRCDFLLMLGANPWESNGSLWTAPNLPARLKALRQRGGTFIVIDPRRTRTAAHADEHHAIRPGTDAAWLLALAQVIVLEDLSARGRIADMTLGIDEVAALLAPYTPEAVAAHCGIAATVTRRIARALAASPAGAVYARFGTHASAYSTLAAWATELLNILTGNLDRAGGVMFPCAAHDRVRVSGGGGAGFKSGRWHSRVRGYPEIMSELPGATLVDEITTPGAGQVRALLTVAGNPVLSTPNGTRLDRALDTLEFMVSVDIYLNETTRHANVILPPPSPLERSHYDMFFYRFAVRAVANYSEPVFAASGPDEAAILARLALIVQGRGSATPTSVVDQEVLHDLIAREIAQAHSPLAGREAAAIAAALTGASPCDRIVDFLLRSGPFGDGFGAREGGLSLAQLRAHPHGLDFGPLQPQLPAILQTASGRIELVHAVIQDELARLLHELARGGADDGLRLIGRREFHSNNSWMHNLPSLVDGHARCVLHMHPDDAHSLRLSAGAEVRVRSRAGAVVVPLVLNADVARGVVSLPHGYGHGFSGMRLAVASAHAGASANDLTESAIDPPSGNAILNGVAVTVEAA